MGGLQVRVTICVTYKEDLGVYMNVTLIQFHNLQPIDFQSIPRTDAVCKWSRPGSDLTKPIRIQGAPERHTGSHWRAKFVYVSQKTDVTPDRSIAQSSIYVRDE